MLLTKTPATGAADVSDASGSAAASPSSRTTASSSSFSIQAMKRPSSQPLCTAEVSWPRSALPSPPSTFSKAAPAAAEKMASCWAES